MCKDFTGREYKNQIVMCNHYGIKQSTYLYRLRKGMSQRDALLAPLNTITYDHLGNEYKTTGDMCKHYGITLDAFHGRMSRGWSLEKSLTVPVGYVDFNGTVFHTKQEMLVYYDIAESTFDYRMKHGWSLKDSLTTKSQKHVVKDFKGIEYPSLYDMCTAYSVEYSTVRYRLSKCWSLDDALSLPSDTNMSSYELLVSEYLTTHNISFHKEHIFPDCKSTTNGVLRFDFYLSSLSIIVEADGEQHFNLNHPWGYEKIHFNDIIKTTYCEEHKIPLLRIKYTQFISNEYKFLIQEFINNPSAYIYQHNSILGDAYYAA